MSEHQTSVHNHHNMSQNPTEKYAKISLKKKMLSELKGYERNNKIHPEIQKDLLERIIAEVGYDVPIVIDKNDVIIAGHCRKDVMERLWYTHIDVVIKDKLTIKQIQRYRLLDNKIAELAQDHMENIEHELAELDDPDMNELYIEPIEASDEFSLPDGDKPEIETVTFTLHRDQNETLKDAIDKSLDMGDFGETGNENKNGNALARICELFIHGES